MRRGVHESKTNILCYTDIGALPFVVAGSRSTFLGDRQFAENKGGHGKRFLESDTKPFCMAELYQRMGNWPFKHRLSKFADHLGFRGVADDYSGFSRLIRVGAASFCRA